MPTQKQSVATQQLHFKIFKFTAYYANFQTGRVAEIKNCILKKVIVT